MPAKNAVPYKFEYQQTYNDLSRNQITERMKKPLKPPLVCTVLSGQTGNEEKALEISHTFKNCPYTYFMAARGNKLFAVMHLTPQRARIWIENQKKNPEAIFGLEKAQVTLVDNVQYPEKLRLRLPKEPMQKTPCGLNCSTCPAYKECTGCPATVHYKK